MVIEGWAATALVIGYIGFGLITAAVLGGMALAISKLNAKLEDLLAKAEPLLAKTDGILTIANDKVASIGDKAEGILAQGEETAESVHHKVDKTATAVQRTIHAPIIGVNSLAAGITRGVETFGRLQRQTVDSSSVLAGEVHTRNGRGDVETAPAIAGKESMNGG